MKRLFLLLSLAVAAALLPGCAGTGASLGSYNADAHRPHNPNDVRVKVSLANRAVYVLEGDRPLLVTATAIGLPEKPTPTGSFRVYSKIPKKRSGSYGFSIDGGGIRPCTAGAATGRYVGFPMAYWVEFSPGYGFHEGAVWPIPRTHGCLRLHKNVAPKFYALVHEGTPVNIAHSQPEDATIGRNLRRPTDYKDPDPPAALIVSDAVFRAPSGSLFVD
jgi:hypothetical protein